MYFTCISGTSDASAVKVMHQRYKLYITDAQMMHMECSVSFNAEKANEVHQNRVALSRGQLTSSPTRGFSVPMCADYAHTLGV